jgi:hypothetical protein
MLLTMLPSTAASEAWEESDQALSLNPPRQELLPPKCGMSVIRQQTPS